MMPSTWKKKNSKGIEEYFSGLTIFVGNSSVSNLRGHFCYFLRLEKNLSHIAFLENRLSSETLSRLISLLRFSHAIFWKSFVH